MSIRKTMITMAIMVTTLIILAGTSQARQSGIARLFDWKLEPVQQPKSPGVVEMTFSFTPTTWCRDCKEAVMTVTTYGGLEFLGPQTWTMAVEQGVEYTDVISVNIPPNDTCGLVIRIGAPNGGRTRAVAYFVTFTDSVEYWKGDPHGAPRRGPSYSEQLRARLTAEQRQQMVDVRIDLREMCPKRLKMVLELVGDLKPTEEDSFLTAQLSRDDVLTLFGWGVDYDVLSQPAPPPNQIATVYLGTESTHWSSRGYLTACATCAVTALSGLMALIH